MLGHTPLKLQGKLQSVTKGSGRKDWCCKRS